MRLLILSIITEIISAVLQQTPNYDKSQYYLMVGLLLSCLSLTLTLTEFFGTASSEKCYWKRFGVVLYWLVFPESERLYGNVVNIFEVLSATFQLVTAFVQYILYKVHKSYDLNFSTFPLLFATCVLCSRICNAAERFHASWCASGSGRYVQLLSTCALKLELSATARRRNISRSIRFWWSHTY